MSTMKIHKIINNNVISSFDSNQNEVVVMGRGVGFQKKPGDLLDDSKVEKVFSLDNSSVTNQFKTLMETIPIEHVRIANEIISYAKNSLGKKLSDNIYVFLTDHLNFAVERYHQGYNFQNALLLEIRRFYNPEFLVGKEALTIIKKHLGIEFSVDEAGFIAMHIVNAEMDTDMNQSITMTKVIQAILNIVKYHFHIQLDEESLPFERFVTHLKYFAQRIFNGRSHKRDDPEFCAFIKKQYPKEYTCAKKIEEYIRKMLNYVLTEEELVYLTIHIKRIAGNDV